MGSIVQLTRALAAREMAMPPTKVFQKAPLASQDTNVVRRRTVSRLIMAR